VRVTREIAVMHLISRDYRDILKPLNGLVSHAEEHFRHEEAIAAPSGNPRRLVRNPAFASDGAGTGDDRHEYRDHRVSQDLADRTRCRGGCGTGKFTAGPS
jgi:hypothetical protein